MEEIDIELKALVESIGEAVFSGLIGVDGLPVFIFSKESFEKSEVSAEFAAIFNAIIRSVRSLDFGKMTDAFISTDKFVIILSPVVEEYFLALGLRMPSNLGRARLEMKRIVPKLEEMLK